MARSDRRPRRRPPAAGARRRRSAEIAEPVRPEPEHRGRRYEIANLQGQAGDVAGALSAIEQLLPEALAQFGPDHPNTLRMRDSLAGWRAAVGDLAGSVKALEDVVAESQRIFGPDHFETLTSRQRLASYRLIAGDAVRALVEFERLLPRMTELLVLQPRFELILAA